MKYPTDKCYFCFRQLSSNHYCENERCYHNHMYHAVIEDDYWLGEVGFKIDNYAFDYYSDGTMEVCILDRYGIIKEVIPMPWHIYADLESYLEVVEKAKKLRVFK